MAALLWTATVILLILWLLGMAMHVGSLIHILLILAIVVFIVNMFSGTPRTT